MAEDGWKNRGELVKNAVVFQLKLLADGLRDLVLMPVSIVAALVGLLRGEDHPEKEFESVLEWGRQSERWINLFGSHEPFEQAGDVGSIDRLVSRAEAVVRDQVARGDMTASAGDAVNSVLDKLHRRAQQSVPPDDGSTDDRSV